MADPRRLIDEPEGSVFGRALIASAQEDAPSPDSRARAARRLGIAAVLAAGAGAGTEGTAIAAVWKLAAVLIALGGVVGLAVWQSPADPLEDRVAPVIAAPSPPTRGGGAGAGPPEDLEAPWRDPAPPPAPRAPAEPPSAVAPSAGVPAPRLPSAKPPRGAPAAHPARVAVPPPAEPAEPAEPVAPPDAPAPELAPAPEEVAPPVEPAPPPVAAPAAPPITGPSRLAAEVALVDRARRWLGAGNYPAALAALAEYHQRFPDGDLDAEAEVVMIETLIAARELAQARALGTAFLARFPRSPLAQRVHSLIDRLPARLPSPVRTPN